MDLWCSQKMQCLTKMSDLLWKFQPQKLMKGDVKFLPNRIRQACETLEQLSLDFTTFVNDVERYHLSCLKDLQLESSQLSEVISNYCILISTQESWEETGLYYAQMEDQSSPSPRCPNLLAMHAPI